MTVIGSTVRENLNGSAVLEREINYSLEKPIDHEGGIAVLKGNLACPARGVCEPS
ncbi:hypothetical protein [Neobacillus sp. LXY-1]|uniref:hypothetical protein n=1 Tax=Neobacillus sp. LXY-1 TaxID=3379133 RepID=UPI003F4A7CBF